MKRLEAWFRRHQARVWLLTAALLGLLVLNVAAVKDTAPQQWEYKAVWFRVNSTDNLGDLQAVFARALNEEAAAGWEFAGRCAHVNPDTAWIDYVVFRRPKR